MSVKSLRIMCFRRWSLVAALLLLVTLLILLYCFWPMVIWQSSQWQRVLNQQMIALLQQVTLHPGQAGGGLLLFSLAYGILHALGPGHGKVVIATFLATHPARLKTSLKLTMLASLVQGSVAVILVTLMLQVLQLSSRHLHLSSFWLEKSSYLLVTLLGVAICWRAVRQWRTAPIPEKNALRAFKVSNAAPVAWRPAPPVHDAHCGCGHRHLPDDAMLEKATSLKTQTLVVLSMGMRPCSGAIMMLLFARVVDVYLWGVLSAMVMAVGTALTVSLTGFFVHRSRAAMIRIGERSVPGKISRLVPLLACAGGIILIIAGLVLWLSARPMASGGLRPF